MSRLDRALLGGREGRVPLPVNNQLPLLVLLHGRGDRPRSRYLPLSPPRALRVIMPRAPEPFGDGYSWFTYRAGQADAAALARGIEAAAAKVAAAIELWRTRRPTLGAPIVGGFSQGGMLSYALAVRHPASLQLALPLGGLLPEPLWPTRKLAGGARAPKIRAAHGTRDTLVPFARARATAAALAEHGYDVQLLEEDGVAHAIGPRMIDMFDRELAAALDAMPRR
jgi:phospholipase/carboxylesterase